MALEFIAGVVGGCAGVAVGHPFDTVKVKLQTQDAANPKYKGSWHCLTQTVAKDSVRGLYKGMSSPMAGVAAVNGIIFGVHGSIMKKMSDPDALSSHATAGATAGLVQAFVASPMELAKTRIQIQSDLGGPAKYKNPLDCLRQVLKSEGVRGVFRGQGITIMREIPAFATYFASYEYFVRNMSFDGDVSTAAILMAGGMAGTASWVLTYPIDVVKSRLQADGMMGTAKYKGAFHCLRSSVDEEGKRFLVKGLGSTILRSFPTNAATFAVVKWTMEFLEGRELPQSESYAWRDVLSRGEVVLTAAAATAPMMNRLWQAHAVQKMHLIRLRNICSAAWLPAVYAKEDSFNHAFSCNDEQFVEELHGLKNELDAQNIYYTPRAVQECN